VLDPDLGELVARIPEGWTQVSYAGRRYGLSRTSRARGRAVSLYARELGGTDTVSANLYAHGDELLLRPCEMPAEKVRDFLHGWSTDHRRDA
jgi:peptide-methionine (S)-S-oxide reductase